MSKTWLKRIIALIVVIIVVIILCYFYYEDKYYPSTDDAYVHGDSIDVASQVSGNVKAVYIKNLERVHQGQLLFTLDSKRYQLAYDQALAQLQMAQAGYRDAKASYALAQSVVSEMQKQVNIAEVSYKRILTLNQKGLISNQDLDNSRGQLDQARQGLFAAQVKVQKAKSELADYKGVATKLAVAKAQLNQAKLDLEHTKIEAPNSGHVVNFSLQGGTWVSVGVPVFKILTDKKWVLANFKETQLTRIKAGQKATVTLDVYPDYTYHGVVETMSASSGAFTSLLPPENASGNWVKVVSRFPVKIKITNLNAKYPLLDGASASVSVDTTHSGQ